MITLTLSFLLGLLGSAVLVPVGRVIAVRLGYVVEASDALESRSFRRAARCGGIAIGLSLFLCSLGLGVVESVPALIFCSGVVFILGIMSDLITLKPSTKLLVLIAVASVFLFFDLRLHWANSITLDSIITVFWIVGVTSAFNLLDSMDGLCGGVSLIAGAAFIATVLPIDAASPLFLRTQYLVVLLGAIAGFLIYNIYPASVAMGESGNWLIGLNMAAMTLQVAPGRGSDLLSIVAVPVLLMLIPALDAAIVAVSFFLPAAGRRRGRSSHRLVAIGLSERAAVGLLWMLAAISGLIGIMAERTNYVLVELIAAIFTIGLAIGFVYLGRLQVHEGADSQRLPGTIVPLGVGFGYRRRLVEVLLDLLLVSLAYHGAYRLRFERELYAPNFVYFLQSFPIVLAMQVSALFAVGSYRGMWRYFSLNDALTYAKGVVLGVIATQAALLSLYRFEGYSQSVFVIYGMLLLMLLVGSRASFRLVSESIRRWRRIGQRIVIYGADDIGSTAVRQLLSDTRTPYRIVGFIDDNPRKRDARIHGYRVIGGYDHLAGLIMAGELDAVAITREEPDTWDLGVLCNSYGVALQRLQFDWREVGTPVDAAEAEGLSRFVRFDEVAGAPAASASFSDASPDHRRSKLDPDRGSARAPVRVLHIITRLILGGAQEDTLYSAIGQHRDLRWDVTLLCGVDEAGEGNMFSVANSAGINTVVLPSLVREIRPFTDLRALIDLYRFLKEGAFTIVHTHSSKAGIIGRIAARAAGVPIVVHTLHGLAFHGFQAHWKNRLYIWLKRACAPMTDKLISVSDRVSETALAHGIGNPEQYITVHSGIELDLFLTVGDRLSVEEAKSRIGIPPHAPVVGKIARLFPLKGHDQFLWAATEILRQMPETYFLLVGDGPLRAALLAEAKRLGIEDRVVMAGRVPPARVPEYIQAMDVVVHTSLREGIPRVLPQAGAVGKPVVTFNLDGAPEVIEPGISGYLVPPLDVSEVARRTVELLRDPDRRRAFGNAGRAFASEHFSVERMVERTNAVYVELLRSRCGYEYDSSGKKDLTIARQR